MSSLPKIKSPLFQLTIPSNKQVVHFRPFLVKEEKILLIAQSSDSRKDMILALKQILNNCIISTGKQKFNVDALTLFDIEYIFLKIRSKSIDNIIKLSYEDSEDGKVYSFEVNLDLIEITTNPNHTNKIQINDDVGIIMKYPSADTVEELEAVAISNPADMSTQLIISCIDKIFDTEEVYLIKDHTPEEINEFIDSIPSKAYEAIQEFFDTIPKLYHRIEYTNSKGTDRVIELSTLNDFFTLQ